MIWLGWPFCIAGLIAGSFANTIGALIMTQGIMYGSESIISLTYPQRYHAYRCLWTLTIISWLPYLLLAHHQYRERMVDSTTRYGIWSHDQRGRGLWNSYAPDH